jgi:hypothetical protein
MKKNIELLKGFFGDQITELSEDNLKEISEKFEKLVESRVDAKVKFQTEVLEAEAKEKYDVLLTEATKKFEEDLKKVEETVVEKSTSFKTKLEENMKKTVEGIKETKDTEYKTFKESMVDKLDKYLELELDKQIPEIYVEALAKVEVLEPFMEGIKKVAKDTLIPFDEENIGLLKDARKEIVKLREEVAEATTKNMDINSELKDYKRSVKISEVCEGLTESQREKTLKLLESYDVDEINDRWNAIRDIIIEEKVAEKEEKEEEEKEEEAVEKCEKVAEESKCGKKVKEEEITPKSDKGVGVKESVNEPADEVIEEEIITETPEEIQIKEWAERFRDSKRKLV